MKRTLKKHIFYPGIYFIFNYICIRYIVCFLYNAQVVTLALNAVNKMNIFLIRHAHEICASKIFYTLIGGPLRRMLLNCEHFRVGSTNYILLSQFKKNYSPEVGIILKIRKKSIEY